MNSVLSLMVVNLNLELADVVKDLVHVPKVNVAAKKDIVEPQTIFVLS